LIPRRTSQQSNGPGNRAERLLQELEPFGQRRIVRGHEAADHVGVAAEVLRRRVDDEVGAERERLLQIRRRERVVHDDDGPDAMRGLGDPADVDDAQVRVRRRLDPDEPCALVDGVRQLVRARQSQM